MFQVNGLLKELKHIIDVGVTIVTMLDAMPEAIGTICVTNIKEKLKKLLIKVEKQRVSPKAKTEKAKAVRKKGGKNGGGKKGSKGGKGGGKVYNTWSSWNGKKEYSCFR